MKKIFSVFLMVAVLLGLVACASGNALVTGTQRPATSPESVVLYTEAPEKYEVIGIVNASSDATGSAQTDLNYAVAELKKQAAKIGANGIILQDVSSSSGDGILIGNVLVYEDKQKVSGKAIYVFGKE
ncbi:MAG: hypothetical protein J6X11_00370 [Treponema sp.]|nr:hypothetical protein [Treponema sp.]MBP5746835.1 hypothetical protein [Treponema sp.]